VLLPLPAVLPPELVDILLHLLVTLLPVPGLPLPVLAALLQHLQVSLHPPVALLLALAFILQHLPVVHRHRLVVHLISGVLFLLPQMPSNFSQEMITVTSQDVTVYFGFCSGSYGSSSIPSSNAKGLP